MIKSLYNSFAERWYRGGTIWFYSDPHFGDADSYKRRFKRICRKAGLCGIDENGNRTYPELTPELIKFFDEWQVSRINKKLGKNDTIIFLGDIGDASYIKKIKGYKVLIMGNHEAGATNYDEFFNEVYEADLIIGPKLRLSHEPIEDKYKLNLHGHDHSNKVLKDDLHINLCAEWIDYTPVPIGDIIKSGKLKNAIDIHREAIDKQAADALKREEK